MKTCPTCGQRIPQKHPNTFPANLRTYGKQQKFIDMVFKAGRNGIEAEAAFQRLYVDDEDGGPLTGRKILAVMVWHINKKLKPLGYRIKGTGAGVPGIYRWTKL